MKHLFTGTLLCVIALGSRMTYGQVVPLADHHQHLFSPAIAALISPPPPGAPVQPITGKDLISLLDQAGIKRAAVLSTAYIFSQPTRSVENDYDKVKADNDWTSDQVALFPDRLVGFCGLNPIREYALEELARCAKNPQLRRGLKLHFGNSGVDYHNPQHVEQLRRVFRAANDYRMSIVVHLRASISQKLAYGRDEALVFLNEILPSAPAVTVQIAHLAGAGAPADTQAEQALQVFVEAVQRGDPRTKQLWFDVTGVANPNVSPEQAALIVTQIRKLGVSRILYGSDAATPNNSPREGWAAFLKVPLSASEFQTIANNVPPYMK
jgi:predicted TIM-barrel fold metal-dependent hydrolase